MRAQYYWYIVSRASVKVGWSTRLVDNLRGFLNTPSVLSSFSECCHAWLPLLVCSNVITSLQVSLAESSCRRCSLPYIRISSHGCDYRSKLWPSSFEHFDRWLDWFSGLWLLTVLCFSWLHAHSAFWPDNIIMEESIATPPFLSIWVKMCSCL